MSELGSANDSHPYESDWPRERAVSDGGFLESRSAAMLAAGMIMLVMFLAALAGSPTVVHNDTGRRAAFASGVPDVAAVQVSPSSTTSPSTPSAADAMSETPNARPASTPIVSSTSPTQ